MKLKNFVIAMFIAGTIIFIIPSETYSTNDVTCTLVSDISFYGIRLRV